MEAAGHPSCAESRAELVFPMPPAGHPIINDQLHDNAPGGAGTVSNVFTNRPFPFALALNPLLHAITSGATVSGCTGQTLLLNKFSRSSGKSFRPFQSGQRFLTIQKPDRFIDRGNAFVGYHANTTARKDIPVTMEPAAKFAQEACIQARISTGQIDLRQNVLGLRFINSNDGSGKNLKKNENNNDKE